MVIDAHLHLWKRQCGCVNDEPVYDIGGGKSNFGGEIRQMLPPYLHEGVNSVEVLMANMDYARVQGCVVTQEYIDGNQDLYLREAKKKYPKRIKICSLYEEEDDYHLQGFDGIKICAGRLKKKKLEDLICVFKNVEEQNKFISIDLADGSEQVPAMKYLIKECPNLKIAIGHFGMVTREGWEEQVKLACEPNVYLESGGITWLFHNEFYPYPSAIQAILKAKEICGMEKLMWGSDYPRTMTAITYSMSCDFVRKSDCLTEHDKSLFLGEVAKNFYGFEELPMIPYIKNMVED